jgi:hypothetical protein
MLATSTRNIIKQAKARATTRIEKDASRKGLAYTTLDVTTWENTPRRIKALVAAKYREYSDNSIMDDRDMTVALRGRDVNVLRWALSEAANLQRSGNL